MAERFDVVVLGDINADLVFTVKSPPKPGESVAAESVRIYHGGVGGNLAAALTKLGLRVALVGAVGSDVVGRVAVEELKRLGVNVNRVRVVEGETTGLMAVFVDESGERAIAGARSANAKLKVEREDLELAKRARHVHVSGYSMLNDDYGEGALALLRVAIEGRATTSVDLEGVAYGGPEAISELRGLVTYATMNALEAAAANGVSEFSESAALGVLEILGAKTAFVKLGGDGCLVVERGRVQRLPAYRVRVVDTTGAGDAFNAGLIYGLLRGLAAAEAARIANAAGAYKCTGRGARHYASASELAKSFPDVAGLLSGKGR